MSETDTDLIISTGLDQSLTLDQATLDKVYKRVDQVLGDFDKSKSPDKALKAAKDLVQAAKVSGLGLAKLLYGLGKRWKALGMEDEFEDRAISELSLSRATIQRYTDVWEKLHEESTRKVPAELQSEIAARPIKQQVRIVSTVKAAGGKLKKSEWREIANTNDDATLKTVTNAILGRPERKNGMTLQLDRRDDFGNAELLVFGNNKRISLGMLRVLNDTDTEDEKTLRECALARIIKNCGILEAQ